MEFCYGEAISRENSDPDASLHKLHSLIPQNVAVM